MVSGNEGIHAESELVVKDCEGTWQEIREIIQKVQERQRKSHDQKRQPAPDYVTLEDVIQGRRKKADRVLLNRKNLRTKWPTENLDDKILNPLLSNARWGLRLMRLSCWKDGISILCSRLVC